MSRNAFFSSRSSRAVWIKNISFDVDIVAENQSKCGLSGFVLLSTTSTPHNSFPKHVFVLFLHVERWACESFERKVWRVQVAHLHNAARALSIPSRCFQLWTNLDKDFCRYIWYCGKKSNRMSFSVVLVKFHWFGVNWHVLCRNCRLYIIIQKIGPQAESGKYFQIWFFPDLREKWRRSEHAHASYLGLSLRPPGFRPYMGRKE